MSSQLFGMADPDEDVSPDSADPEAIGNAGNTALESEKNEEKVSTLQWAQSHNYDPKKLFQKLFHDDIKYLLSMENLWQRRQAPIPLDFDDLPDASNYTYTCMYF
jgi:ubiquitin-like 1-activating enzyme E1 B